MILKRKQQAYNNIYPKYYKKDKSGRMVTENKPKFRLVYT